MGLLKKPFLCLNKANAFGLFIIVSGLLSLFWSCNPYLNQNTNQNTVFGTSFIPTPSENPLSKEKIELGRKLFFDPRLSINGTISCANCHNPNLAFCDNLSTSTGILGQKTQRNAPSLLNAAFLPTVMFDAHLKSLELQIIVPLQEPTEMGHNMKNLIPVLRAIPEYQKAAKEIFNRDFDAYVLTRSIASFERSLISLNSRYDQYVNGKKTSLSSTEKRGMQLFMNELYCVSCHPPPYFTTFKAENNGLYQEYGEDKGRFRIKLDSNDIGKFKVPSLRNIALTFPYMHDGSIKNLENVIAHYAKGGQNNKNISPSIVPFQISEEDKKCLISFLHCLTDTTYIKSFP